MTVQKEDNNKLLNFKKRVGHIFLTLVPFVLLIGAFYSFRTNIWITLLLFLPGLGLIWLVPRYKNSQIEFFVLSVIALFYALSPAQLPFIKPPEQISPTQCVEETMPPDSKNQVISVELLATEITDGIGDLNTGEFVTALLIKPTEKDDKGTITSALELIPYINLKVETIYDEDYHSALSTGKKPNSIVLSGTETDLFTILEKIADGFKIRLLSEGEDPKATPTPESDEATPEPTSTTNPVEFVINREKIVTEIPNIGNSVTVVLVYEVFNTEEKLTQREAVHISGTLIEKDNEEVSINVPGNADDQANIDFAKWLSGAIEVYIQYGPAPTPSPEDTPNPAP